MPRPLRIEFEGAWYHVMNRGANHQSIFKKIDHRKLFLTLLEEISIQFKIEVHAYCLMDNHYHLLLKTSLANLSKAMRYLNGVYTQKINRSLDRDGPLFRGRYKSILVQDDSYLLHVSRYIHLNPVMAKIENAINDLTWTSYQFYINSELKISWLHVYFIQGMIDDLHPWKYYEKFLAEGIDKKTLKFYSKKYLGSIFGDKNFIDKNLNGLNENYKKEVITDFNRTQQLPSIDMILYTVAKHYNIDVKKLLISNQGKKNRPRIVAIYLSRKLGQHTYQKISSYFKNITCKSISAKLIRFKKLLEKDELLYHDINKISSLILRQMIDDGT